MESSGEGSVWSGMQADTEASVRASGVWESPCPQSWTESGPGRGKAVNLARLRNWRKADMESPSYSPCHQRGRRPAAKSPLTFLHIYCENRETITLFFYIAFLAQQQWYIIETLQILTLVRQFKKWVCHSFTIRFWTNHIWSKYKRESFLTLKGLAQLSKFKY